MSRSAGVAASVYVDFPTQPDQRLDLAVAVSWRDREEGRDQAYIDEMNRWLRDPDVHGTSDGIPPDAIPHVSDDHPRHTDGIDHGRLMRETLASPTRVRSWAMMAGMGGLAEETR